MPELPEVQQAADLVKQIGLGCSIFDVKGFEDSIVFEGISHDEFAKELEGRTILDVKRYGKLFYFELDGKGRFPLFHFGMSGFLQVKGAEPFKYVQKIKTSSDWPPKYAKFTMRLHGPQSGEGGGTELAFCDPRRLGRIRLRLSPKTEHPICDLGFDPLISRPDFHTYKDAILKKKNPIKALLLDQSFNAGIGNWLADEILYHSGVHPEVRCHNLTEDEILALYNNTEYVCRTAVEVGADSARFPAHWLFKHRWGKGKKGKNSDDKLLLSSGKAATIKWITVGGRTSAVVPEVQKLHGQRKDRGSV